ncbi:MAG: hypothetical protein RMN25_11965 [Anaerolineae bacterium]|nr:hypothetical protein [Thermoflexales bacterium]MDW8408486.1 hypothetical protein [Anaerolineae bacterium]
MLVFGVVLYGFVVVRTAWVGEDAFITLRTVDNFVNGYGPVWNTDERVQAFTHPLWMLVLSAGYSITREAHFTTLGFSIVLSLLTVGLILWQAKGSPLIMLPAVAALVGSKAFVDYSTSGLENPLSHTLIAAVILLYAHDLQAPSARRTMWMALIAGLAVLNRMDVGLIVLPAVIERSMRLRPAERVQAWLIMVAPVMAWMAFSTFYYGFPLPNTYYAKQAAGIPRAQYIQRGLEYVASLVTLDPLTAVVIVLGLISLFFSTAGRRLWPVTLGAWLYLAYIVWSGGDFMQGRFFSPVFLTSITCALCLPHQTPLLNRLPLGGRWIVSIGLTSGITVLGLLAQPVPNLLSDERYPRPLFNPSMRIVDERGFYYWASGLLPAIQSRDSSLLHMPWVQQGIKSRNIEARLHVFGEIGFRGYFAGPKVKFVDPYALADAFLARLPYYGASNWRIGHVSRVIPPGYLETRLTGQNRLTNENLKRLYDQLDLITRGPLWDTHRLQTIIAFNLKPVEILPSDLEGAVVEDLTFEQFALGVRRVEADGLRIFLPASQERLPETLVMRSDSGTNYTLLFLDGEAIKGKIEIPALSDRPADEPTVHYITTASRQIGRYDTLKLIPHNPGPSSSAGLLHIVPDPFLVRTRIPRVYGITLSSTVGLSISDQHRKWVEGRRMVGLWETDERRDLSLSLALFPLCPEADRAQHVTIKVNRILLGSHSWYEQECAHSWSAELVIPAGLVGKGTNTIEIESAFVTQLTDPDSSGIRYASVAVEYLKITSAPSR